MGQWSRRVMAAVVAVASLMASMLTPWATGVTSAQIVDGPRGGVPEFVWLPPTVPSAPPASAAFDVSAFRDLSVEICQLADASTCVEGPPLAVITSRQGNPRLTTFPRRGYYEAIWAPARTQISPENFYRATVRRDGAELGSIDIDVVRLPREWVAVDRSQYVGLRMGNQLRLRFRLELPSAVNRVRVNEVESSGGDPGDWIELHNSAPVPLDLSGYIFRDNDDTRGYTLPAGTIVPAGGYLVLDEALFGFGLGSSDSARLFDPSGNLVDSYTWTAHAATTYGRCPDGTGQFQVTNSVTKGGANDCAGTAVINEIESSGGTPGDWVELFNPGPAPASLEGWIFRDNDDTRGYTLPAGTTIPAGGYLVLDEALFGFGLGSSDSARLFDPSGNLVDSYTWTAHAATTYGRCPNGSGGFTTTNAVTKAAVNDCGAPAAVRVNEVESSGGTPGDWAELVNLGTEAADLSGWIFRDNDDTRGYTLPAGTTIPAGGYLVLDEALFGFGLGSSDSARLFDPSGNLVDSYTWTAHAATTYGRCPDATGSFATTTTVTKGSANDCGSPIKVNEVESSGGDPGDWVELHNPTDAPVDVSGYLVRDNDDTRAYTIPASTTIAARGYLVVDEAQLGFGLGSSDSARLFDSSGALVDGYTWTSHALTTYGRCPDGTGAFETTTESTRGAANRCPGQVIFDPWPGGSEVTTADVSGTFGTNLSGLDLQGRRDDGILWAAKNGPGTLYRLLWDGSTWVADTTVGWSNGKSLRYPDGGGDVDAEGVTIAGTDGSVVFIASERNNANSGVSRNSILAFSTLGSATTLTATGEWNLTADLPSTAPNAGLEAITWIPDTFLVEQGFIDGTTGQPYNPANYPGHGDGLFVVGVEATGDLHVYALDLAGTGFTRIATIDSGFPGVMALEFDPDNAALWAVCDDGCQGRSAVLGLVNGVFSVTANYDRPTGMPNLNNEGFAIAPAADCDANGRPVWWADDAGTAGHALRQGSLSCN